jgi:transposase InsO family protein
VRQPRIFPYIGWYILLTWLLLAYSHLGHHRAGKDLQGMSVSCQANPHTGTNTVNDLDLMAIHHVGARHPGTIPGAVGGYRYLCIAIDKFIKWPAATPVVNIIKQTAIKFIKSIICRFGVPNRIITDNRSQFTNSAFQGYSRGSRACSRNSKTHESESLSPARHANRHGHYDMQDVWTGHYSAAPAWLITCIHCCM